MNSSSLNLSKEPSLRARIRRDALRNLAILRTLAPPLQLALIVVVQELWGVVSLQPGLWIVLGLEVLSAIAAAVHLRLQQSISPAHLVGHVMIDFVLFGAVLSYTGGISNPFSVLFVVPYIAVSVALDLRWLVLLALAALVEYVVLGLLAPPLTHPDGVQAMYELQLKGRIATFFVAAALLTFFVHRLNVAVKRNERLLNESLALQRRNESVTAIAALAAGYAHELSTPLGTMSLLVEELQHQADASNLDADDLRKLQEQIVRCKRIVSNLASAGGQRRSESARAVHVDAFLKGVIGQVRDLYPSATILPDWDPEPPPLIVGEETLRQTITNIVQNAVQASPHHVEVQARWSGLMLRVTVRDRGPGIPFEILEAVGQAQLTTRSESGGLGLGLVLSAVTLESLGGRLALANPPSGGARARVEIPLATIAISPRDRSDAAQPSITSTRAGTLAAASQSPHAT